MFKEDIKAQGGEEKIHEASISDEAETEQKTPRIVRVLEKGMWELKRDPEFEALLAPLEKEELIKLKNGIQRDGCTDSLYTWNKVIIDGHNRYSLCWELRTPFIVTELEFTNRNEAVLWIIERQLGRRNLPPYKKGELILLQEKIYAERAKQNQGRRNDLIGNISANSRSSQKAVKKMAETIGIGENTMQRIKKLSREADDDTKKKLRNGEVTINKAYTDLIKKSKSGIQESVSKGKNSEGFVNQYTPEPQVIEKEGVIKHPFEAENTINADVRAAAGVFPESDDYTEKNAEVDVKFPIEGKIQAEDIEDAGGDEAKKNSKIEEGGSVYSESDFTYDRVTKYPGITVLDHPIELPTNRCAPHQDPRPFIFVQGQVHYALTNMLKELQIGLDWIMDEDRKRIPELMKMLKSTTAKAEQMLKEMEETDD